MGNGPQNLWIEPRIASQLLSIDLIALAVTMRDGPQLSDVRHNHLVAKGLKLLADPDRMDASFHSHTRRWQILEPLLDRLRCGPEPASINNLAVLVESAVMAPDIAKIDANRQLGPSLPAGNFHDEVLRQLLHGKQSAPPPERPAHPICRY
jgi:hypothetical protein